MTAWRFLPAAAAIAIGAAAIAADEWKTLTLQGEAGFTIAVPQAAVNTADENDPDNLLFISVKTKSSGSMICMLQRMDYPKEAAREKLAAALATPRRENFCQTDKATAGTLSIGGSHSFDRDGMQGAVCTASFTDAAAKLPGQVQSQMMVAAASGMYTLTCIVEDEDQESAEYSWSLFWGKKVRHIQESLRLPASR